jgi:hypothetical protein
MPPPRCGIGQRNPSFLNLRRLADALGVEPEVMARYQRLAK